MTTVVQAPDPQLLEQKFGIGFQVLGGIGNAVMLHFGGKLGLYKGMQGIGEFTSAELATKLGLSERFVREWLYQQAALGVIENRGPERFEMLPESALVFADETFPLSMSRMLQHFPGWFDIGLQSSQAFKTGLGQPYDGMGEQGARIMDAFFSGWNKAMLVPDALPRLAGVVEKLQRGAKVADVGCGGGAAPIAIASAFPNAEVHGYDNSVHALTVAAEAKREAGCANVTFHNPDHDPLPTEPTFDLVLTLDCLHDMARPDIAAAAIRRAIKPDGAWFIVDIDAAPTAVENVQHPLGSMLFGASILACLQSSASTPDGMALGPTGLPEPKMRELVTNAGFTRFTRVEGMVHPMNAYYEVRP